MHSSRWIRPAVLPIWMALSCVVVHAQSYRGEAVPVAMRVDPVELSRFRFLTFAFGREGPMDAPLTTPPVGGREYFVEADVFGIESAANIRFELVDTANRTLQSLILWKASDGSSDGEFYGFVTSPNQAFRVVASGTRTDGVAFRSVLPTLFQPSTGGPAERPILPLGISAIESAQAERMIAAYRQELQRRAAQSAVDHPGGTIVLARAVVSRIAYEPLPSSSGTPIGVRLRYTIQFPSRQTIVAVPHVFPVYSQTAWRGLVAMKALGGTIAPAPQMPGVQSLRETIIYGAPATYQAGTPYTFTIEMVPDYIFQGSQTGRFCIHEQKFNDRAVWDALKTSSTAVPYSISIMDTETYANIPVFYPQRTFYETFVSAGAFDCGPVPNIRF